MTTCCARPPVDALVTIRAQRGRSTTENRDVTSIGPISPASFLNPVNAAQSAGTQGARHHQATASDPDGDGIPDRPSSSASTASPASALSSALNTTA